MMNLEAGKDDGMKALDVKRWDDNIRRVWCNFVSPSFSLIRLCIYLPSYLGPNRDLRGFTMSDERKLFHL